LSTTRKIRVSLVGVVAVLVAALLLASPTADLPATQPAADPASDQLALAKQMRAVCVVQLQTATTTEQRTRANNCIADMDRVIKALSVSASPSPTLRPTSPPVTRTPSPTPLPVLGFPNPATTGTPAGWTPVSTRTTDLRVTTAGAVVQDVRLVNADIVVDAANVTVRRVEIQGGRIDNAPSGVCRNGLVIENTSIIRAPAQITRATDQPAIMHGGYTARGVEVIGLPEAFRVGGRGSMGCGPVTLENTFAKVVSPDVCGDWHGDGVQGYDGAAVTIRNVTVDLTELRGCGGTAPFFYPRNQGNTSAYIDRLLVKGGGFAFRNGMPGSVKGLKIADGSWGYGPIDVRCSVLTGWDAQIVKIDSNYQVTSAVRSQACNTESGY
jgi:hypothetical protein